MHTKEDLITIKTGLRDFRRVKVVSASKRKWRGVGWGTDGVGVGVLNRRQLQASHAANSHTTVLGLIGFCLLKMICFIYVIK